MSWMFLSLTVMSAFVNYNCLESINALPSAINIEKSLVPKDKITNENNKNKIFSTQAIGDDKEVDEVKEEESNYEAELTVKKLDDNIIKENGFYCDCFYYNADEMNVEIELECKCSGKDLLEVPQDLNKTLNKLVIIDADIGIIRNQSFAPYRLNLREVTLGSLPQLRVIEPRSFADIPNLQTLYITHAPQLKYLDGLLEGMISTKFLTLRIVQTGLVRVPDLHHVDAKHIMHILDLDLNKIEKLAANSVRIRADQVTMNLNEITSIEDYAFNGSQIEKLSFRDNRHLRNVGANAFAGLTSLRELDLSTTSIEHLPVVGLSELEILKIEKTPSLKIIPSIYDLANLKIAKLTHPFHCCAFKYPEQHHPEKYAKYQEKFKVCKDGVATFDTGQIVTTVRPHPNARKRRHIRSSSSEESEESDETDVNWGDSINLENGLSYENTPDSPSEFNSSGWEPNPVTGETISYQAAKLTEENEDLGFFHAKSAEINEHKAVNAFCGSFSERKISVKCYPEPNALNPCEDIMGSSWLRISVWFVVVLAVLGNLAVIVVVIFSGGEVTVSRFLICNLAFADFCMGLYLLLLACMDLHSVGTYFNFAFDWQYGLGCQMAGFLTVFASHLSIFTLTVVTIERWFAITYAIHLTRRIRIGAAAKTMLGGWVYSILIAAFPLLGISSYSSTSICLPMEVNKIADKAYLYIIIIVSGIAFILIVVCYAQIYFSLGYETRRANTKGEMTIAKKMALLIFTDFATWAPIAFFGLTALAGYPLIGVTRSKILLVFFYPLNACANPYLYALMTAQYRKDFFQLISRFGFCKKAVNQYTVTTTIRSSNNSQPVPLLTKTNGNYPTKTSEVDDTYV